MIGVICRENSLTSKTVQIMRILKGNFEAVLNI